MARTALVTGGAGFIGSHLADRLLTEGWRVRIVDNFSTGKWENISDLKNHPDVEIVFGDIKSEVDCLEALENIDVVLHFAANPEVRLSSTNPDIHFNENILATFNLLDAMRKKSVKNLVFASSSSVYGETGELPVKEEGLVRPVSVYGASKAACENLIHAYSCLYGIRSTILRYANVVGPRSRHGVIYDFVLKLRDNPKTLEVFGDGSQLRSYVFIDDTVEMTLRAWSEAISAYEIFNIGTEDRITVVELAKIVADTLGANGVRFVFKPILHGIGWPGDIKRISLDTHKIKEMGVTPQVNSRAAIRETALGLMRMMSKSHANDPQ